MTAQFTVRADDITWTQSGNEIVILELGESNYFSLNESGAFLWPELLAGQSVEALSSILSTHYDIPIETATSDVNELLRGLQARNIISTTDHDSFPSTDYPGTEVHVGDQSA